MKRILEIAPMFSFAQGFIGNRFSFLKSNGFEMHLICSDDVSLSSFADKQGIFYKALTINRTITPIQDIIAFFQIQHYVRKNKIDCIVGHADKGTLLAALVGLFTRRKVITFIHGTSFETRKGLSRKIFIFVDWFQSALSTANICVSQFLVDLRAELKIAPINKQFVPNQGSCCGLDCETKFNVDLATGEQKQELRHQLGIRDEDFVIGFCGRFTKDKGIEELVEAFELLPQHDKSYKLLLIGQNDIRDGLNKKTMNTLETDKNIIQSGFISVGISSYYAIMDLFVLPTHRDGFGMCLVEAAAMGVPVLSSPYTGSKNAMSAGNNGEYIELDANDICAKIKELSNDKERLQKYSQYGVKWVRGNFSNLAVWNSIMNIYEDVLK